MAVYALAPRHFLPAGYDIIDDGGDRLPRTYFTSQQPPPRMHEQFMVAIVEPVPPTHLVAIRREQVLHFITQTLQVPVRSTQPWVHGVGLFEMDDPVVRGSFTMHPPFPLGLDEEGE